MSTTSGRSYSELDFKAAYHAITVDKMSVHKASAKFNIPRSTLRSRIDKGQFEKQRQGPSTVLNDAEELRLERWIIYCWQTGFTGCRETLIRATARTLLLQSGRIARFGHFRRRWFSTYYKRHPRVREVINNGTSVQKANWNFNVAQLRDWFERIESYLTTAGLSEALCQPARIFHCNRVQWNTHAGVILSYGADGRATPPLLILPQKLDADALPKGWAELTQSDASADAKALEFYLEQVLQPFLKHARVKFPIIVFQDQQQEAPSFALYEKCQELGIILVNLYYQAFRHLRQSWQEPLHAWHKNMLENALEEKRQYETGFIETLKECLVFKITKSCIKEEFKSAGIFPFLMANVDTSCLVQNMTSPPRHDDLATAESAAIALDDNLSNSSASPLRHDDAFEAAAASTAKLVISQPYTLSLDYEEFKRIVGPAQLLHLQQFDALAPNNANSYSLEFLALQRIYAKLSAIENVPKCESFTLEEEHLDDGYEEHPLQES